MTQNSPGETVIVVHGTFDPPEPGIVKWYQPYGGAGSAAGFTAKLDQALARRASPARSWAHLQSAEPGFAWSGLNSWIDRTSAASDLAKNVTALLDRGWRCHIVAHSHGGNVVMEALPSLLRRKADAPGELASIVTLGTPFVDAVSSIDRRLQRRRAFFSKRTLWFS